MAWPHDLLAAGFAVEAGVVARTVQGAVGFAEGERKALMRADGREADDVAIGADARRDTFAELEQDARRIGIRIGDLHGFIDFQIADIGEPVRRIIDPRSRRRSFRLRRRNLGGGDPGGG